jgi:fatty-acyl-CoA synthase
MTLAGRLFREELRRRLQENHDRVLLRIVVSAGAAPVELTGSDILTRGPELAAAHTHLPQGAVVLLLLPHSVELFLLHLGLVLEGLIPAILAWPTSRIDPEKYQRNLLHQLRHLPAQQLITLPALAANLAERVRFPVLPFAIENSAHWEKTFAAALDAEPAAGPAPRCDVPPGALFLQFSGGTTGAQKAVVVTAPMLEAQLRRLADFLEFTNHDGVASWLPMYHDMGLIACLWLPLWQGAPSLQFSAGEWLLHPELLFQYLDRYRATFCWLPNFAFSYLAAQRQRMRGGYSLEHVRAWINCSEPVRLRSSREFAEAFAEWGVTPDRLQASYAMAENVFAVTQTRPGVEPPADGVHLSSGELLEGMQARAIRDDGSVCAEDEPGNIQLRTESLFGGYWGSGGPDASAISPDGWYTTGDYGRFSAGHLYVIGRLKDIIIVGGQNVFPEDVETVVNSVESIYPGRVVAFGVADEQLGTESIATPLCGCGAGALDCEKHRWQNFA